MKFAKKQPLTETAVIKAIHDVKDPKGVNDVLKVAANFPDPSRRKIAMRLEQHVRLTPFPPNKVENAVNKIRASVLAR